MARAKSTHVIPAADARRLFMLGQGLLDDPERKATPAAVRKTIESMGFVQVDTINVLLRAHHHILLTRFDHYQPRMLKKLLETDRALFEHWTHDASIIPAKWIDHWHHRYGRYARELRANNWFCNRIGEKPDQVIEHVLERVEREGPVKSSHFEHADRTGKKGGGWWSWKPQKAALEYLWWTGRVAIEGRENFQKRYDVMPRVFPDHHVAETPERTETIDWGCRTALDRLGVASPAEIARFWNAIKKTEAAAWCQKAATDGDLVEVLVESADGSKPVPSFALPNWKRRLSRASEPPRRIRLLSPFDPVVRERDRLAKRFNFEYRFEAFVPEKKRTYGYYVSPLLEGDRMVGRLDAKHDRKRETLIVKGLWWEPTVRVTRARQKQLDDALERFAAGIGATRIEQSHR